MTVLDRRFTPTATAVHGLALLGGAYALGRLIGTVIAYGTRAADYLRGRP